MADEERAKEEERRLRRAAVTRLDRQVPEPPAIDDSEPEEPTPEDEDSSRYRRADQRALWVDQQVRQAMRRGEFDNLPGAGKPLKLTDMHDPDWWVKRLIERENITGIAPPAIALRREDAEFEARLDDEVTEDGVRRVVTDFNARVVEARRQLLGGPPVITKTRDPDGEVEAWHARRAARRSKREAEHRHPAEQRRRRWLRRRRG
ncbi:MAG TPA: DUF1992 domain-containing protein [Nocardioidaceae bacterium]|nr:DUF1992 domain-containing protein [Nocardioidaceae bacterium]